MWLLLEDALPVVVDPAATEEKTDEVSDGGSSEKNDKEEEEALEAVAQPTPIPHQVVRILPPVEMMVENEIWQYKYPPFENIFSGVEDHLDHDRGLVRLEHQDVMPSYVIGILDPSEVCKLCEWLSH